jgi:hypothetical protein
MCIDSASFVPEVIEYFTERFVESGHLMSDPNMTRQSMDFSKGPYLGVHSIDSYHTMLLSSNIWMDKDWITKKVVRENNKLKEQLSYKFIDVPETATLNVKSKALLDSLANT